jgi:hypothetical protein
MAKKMMSNAEKMAHTSPFDSKAWQQRRNNLKKGIEKIKAKKEKEKLKASKQ